MANPQPLAGLKPYQYFGKIPEAFQTASNKSFAMQHLFLLQNKIFTQRISCIFRINTHLNNLSLNFSKSPTGLYVSDTLDITSLFGLRGICPADSGMNIFAKYALIVGIEAF